jgi:SSS family solute:Na+ symporter
MLHTLDWIIIALYGAGMITVGWYYARRTSSADDFVLGGRSMSPLGVGLSLFASLLSTISYFSYPGETIAHGPMILAGVFAYPFVIWIVGWYLVPFFMRRRITSAYEILEERFDVSLRLLGASIFVLLRLLWMATIIFVTVSKVLLPLMGVGEAWTPLVCTMLATVTIVYTSLGGLRAVVLTDVVQTCILFGGAILTIVLITVDLGGLGEWWPTQWPEQWEMVWGYDPDARMSFVGIFIATITWHVCTAGSDQIAIQRYLATKDVRSARRALCFSLGSDAVVHIFLSILGFSLLAFFVARAGGADEAAAVFNDADGLFTRFIGGELPVGVCGLIVAGLLAAAMSSLSSGMNSCATVVLRDYVMRFRAEPLSDGGQLRLVRAISVGVGVVVVILSLLVDSVAGNLLEKAYKIVNLLVAPLFVLFFLAFFVKRAGGPSAWYGVLSATLVAILIAYWKDITEDDGISFLWIMPGSLATGVVVGVLFSFIAPRRASREPILPPR